MKIKIINDSSEQNILNKEEELVSPVLNSLRF